MGVRGSSLCGTQEHNGLWLNLEPCGLICAGITWGLIFFSQYVATVQIIRPWIGSTVIGFSIDAVFNFAASLCLIYHIRAMTTDPGSVSSRAEPPQDEQDLEEPEGKENDRRRFWCRRCNAYKPERAHHCSICRRCIVKMDHHCPWVNNCVGIGNHKFFIQFIASVFWLSVFALLLSLCFFTACLHKKAECGSPEGNLLILFLVLESMLFGMFTMCMGFDQWQVVTSGQTQIDRLKGEMHVASLEINEVFGGGKHCRLDWILPTKPSFPADVWEEVMGYRVRPEQRESEMTSIKGRSENSVILGGDAEVADDEGARLLQRARVVTSTDKT